MMTNWQDSPEAQRIFRQGWNAAIDAAAERAAGYCSSIIKCKQTGKAEHVRMHVEFQWAQAVAADIRKMTAPSAAVGEKVPGGTDGQS